MDKDKQIKELKKEMRQNSVNIKTFLINYYGIYNEEIMSRDLTHKTVKVLLPQIKRSNFESLLVDKENLYRGNVVSVVDCNGQVLPYINPHLENLKYIDNVICEERKRKNEEIIENVILDSNLSLYELSILCKKYKENNRLKEYRIAYRLLKKLKEPKSKDYMVFKKHLTKKGNEEYD